METNNRTLHFPNHDELNKHTSYVGHWKILENTWEINDIIALANFIFDYINSNIFNRPSLPESKPKELSLEEKKSIYWAACFKKEVIPHKKSTILWKLWSGFEKDVLAEADPKKGSYWTDYNEVQYLLVEAIKEYIRFGLESNQAIARGFLEKYSEHCQFLGWSELHWAIFFNKDIQEIEKLIQENPSLVNQLANVKDLLRPALFGTALKASYHPMGLAAALGREDVVSLIEKKEGKYPETEGTLILSLDYIRNELETFRNFKG
ncbi:MAG: hypothetical protein KDK71_01180 [Chlamydiia bacterium]|nr:hypothetical protein [Chlamydiia bacterium]